MDRHLLMKPLFPFCTFTITREFSWKKSSEEGGRKRWCSDTCTFWLCHQKVFSKFIVTFTVCMITCISFHHKPEWKLLRKLLKWARCKDLDLSFPCSNFSRFFDHWKYFLKIFPISVSVKILLFVAEWYFLIPLLNTTAFFLANNLMFATFSNFYAKYFFSFPFTVIWSFMLDFL